MLTQSARVARAFGLIVDLGVGFISRFCCGIEALGCCSISSIGQGQDEEQSKGGMEIMYGFSGGVIDRAVLCWQGGFGVEGATGHAITVLLGSWRHR